MAKQPYIPFYVGDYIKDTRRLPLSVRGAWVDILLFMWDEQVKGEIIGTMEEFSGMLSCSRQECEFVVNLLIEKKVCNHENLPGEKIKLISRRMKKDAEISLKRSKSGTLSADSKKVKQQNFNKTPTNESTKSQQNPDIDNIIDTENVLGSLEGKGNLSLKLELPQKILQAAEENQFTHTKKRNTEFIKSQWLVFLHERMNDPPINRTFTDLTRYFLNWMRTKFPKNGTTHQQYSSTNGTRVTKSTGAELLIADLKNDLNAGGK